MNLLTLNLMKWKDLVSYFLISMCRNSFAYGLFIYFLFFAYF